MANYTINTVKGRKKLYELALRDWQETQHRYVQREVDGIFPYAIVLYSVDTREGFCSYFLHRHPTLWGVLDWVLPSLPELQETKPKRLYNSFVGIWYSDGNERGRKLRIKCLEKAIAACDEKIAKGIKR